MEGTLDLKWGSGLDPVLTLECLPDYWLGQNLMGKILKEICSELLEAKWLQFLSTEDHGEKWKVSSPLKNAAKKQLGDT